MSDDTAWPPLTVDEIALAVAPPGGGDFETVVLARRSDGALFERVGRQDWRELPRVPGTSAPKPFTLEQHFEAAGDALPVDLERAGHISRYVEQVRKADAARSEPPPLPVWAAEPVAPRPRPAIVLPAGAGVGLPDVEPLLEKLWHLSTDGERHAVLFDAGILAESEWDGVQAVTFTDDEETEFVRLALVKLFEKGEGYAVPRLRNLATILERTDAHRRLEGRK